MELERPWLENCGCCVRLGYWVGSLPPQVPLTGSTLEERCYQVYRIVSYFAHAHAHAHAHVSYVLCNQFQVSLTSLLRVCQVLTAPTS